MRESAEERLCVSVEYQSTASNCEADQDAMHLSHGLHGLLAHPMEVKSLQFPNPETECQLLHGSAWSIVIPLGHLKATYQ